MKKPMIWDWSITKRCSVKYMHALDAKSAKTVHNFFFICYIYDTYTVTVLARYIFQPPEYYIYNIQNYILS